MLEDDRPTNPSPEDEAASGNQAGAGDDAGSVEEFKREIEEDPSANPPEELDRLRGG